MTNTIYTLINFMLICISAMYLLTRSRKIVTLLLAEKKTFSGLIFCILLFSIMIMMTSKFGLPVLEVKTNLRTSIVFFSAIVGGPFCSLVVGIVGFLYRLSLGGWTGLSCAAATLAGGMIASLIAYRIRISPKKLSWKMIGIFTLLVLIWEHIHILIFIPVLSGKLSFATVELLLNWIYWPQIIANSLTMFVLCFLLMDLVTLDFRIISEERERGLRQITSFAQELEIKVDERTKELAEANRKLYEISIRDPMTNLYNRQHLYKMIEDENFRLQNKEYPFYSTLCMDLDNFKFFNDRYGHIAGDIIIKEFANVLNILTDHEDVVFRTGGDEFTVLLPNKDFAQAVSLAQKIISHIEHSDSFKYVLESEIPVKVVTQEKLSCSIGIKTLAREQESLLLNDLLYQADKALLKAKINGKNQYASAS